MHPRPPRRHIGIVYIGIYTNNFELWVETFCVPTCFHMRIPKPCLSVCSSVCTYPEKRSHPGFINISPKLVIDTSMKRSSRVLHHENTPKKFKKFEIWILICGEEVKSLLLRQYQSYIGNWYIIGNWNTKKKMIFFPKKFEIEFRLVFWRLMLKSWNHLSFVNISPTLIIDTSIKRISLILQHGNPIMWIS